MLYVLIARWKETRIVMTPMIPDERPVVKGNEEAPLALYAHPESFAAPCSLMIGKISEICSQLTQGTHESRVRQSETTCFGAWRVLGIFTD
jgi:hypothetical protein